MNNNIETSISKFEINETLNILRNNNLITAKCMSILSLNDYVSYVLNNQSLQSKFEIIRKNKGMLSAVKTRDFSNILNEVTEDIKQFIFDKANLNDSRFKHLKIDTFMSFKDILNSYNMNYDYKGIYRIIYDDILGMGENVQINKIYYDKMQYLSKSDSFRILYTTSGEMYGVSNKMHLYIAKVKSEKTPNDIIVIYSPNKEYYDDIKDAYQFLITL